MDYLVDTHAHLDSQEFDGDRAEVIRRARQSGLVKIVTVGTGVESSLAAVELAEEYPEVLATVGVHPHEAGRASAADVDSLARLAGHVNVVAIGEIGLDFHREYSPRDRQLEVLRLQLDLAAVVDLPVVLHCRDAHREVLDLLHEWASWHQDAGRRCHGVVHCFMGDSQTARQYLKLGFYLSLAGYVTYPGPLVADEVIREIPADRLLVETDCPFLAPEPHRGQRSEPAHVRLTAERLAAVREVPLEELARQTTENARHLFGW